MVIVELGVELPSSSVLFLLPSRALRTLLNGTKKKDNREAKSKIISATNCFLQSKNLHSRALTYALILVALASHSVKSHRVNFSGPALKGKAGKCLLSCSGQVLNKSGHDF